MKDDGKHKDNHGQLSSISKASSYEEMGEFWDTHSIDDYWDQTYDVEFEVKDVLRNRVYLTPELYEQVKTFALERGTRIEVLVNAWVEERFLLESESQEVEHADAEQVNKVVSAD